MSRHSQFDSDAAWQVAFVRMTARGHDSLVTFTDYNFNISVGGGYYSDVESILVAASRVIDQDRVNLSINPRFPQETYRADEPDFVPPSAQGPSWTRVASGLLAVVRVVAVSDARAKAAACSPARSAPTTPIERFRAIRSAVRLRDELWPDASVFADDDAYVLIPLTGDATDICERRRETQTILETAIDNRGLLLDGTEIDIFASDITAVVPIRPERPKWWPSRSRRRPWATELISVPRDWRARVDRYRLDALAAPALEYDVVTAAVPSTRRDRIEFMMTEVAGSA